MRKWKYRSKEIIFLLNPAYCGKIIYSVIKKYNEKNENKNFPFCLCYLILPVMLYSKITDISIPYKNLNKFINDNPEIFFDFAKKAKDLVDITNETIEFLLSGKLIIMNEDSSLVCNEKLVLKDDKLAKKAESFGYLLSNAGSENIIYLMFGVKP